MKTNKRPGPLSGLKIVEFSAHGPVPFCGMLLSDLGADVVRIDRPGRVATSNTMERGRRSIAIDLKEPEGVEVCLKLLDSAAGLVEGHRPGVMERIGLGPSVVMARNPRLIYGRMTGWGQTGPLAPRAGHDINFLAISGALHSIGVPDQPVPPLNLLGDFASAAYLAFGLLAALTHARDGGQGQVVDCAMAECVASMMTAIYGMKAQGVWKDQRGGNLLDGTWPMFGTYRCADGRWIAVGAVEPQFQATLLETLGLNDAPIAPFAAEETRRTLRARMEAAFMGRARDEWIRAFEGLDACVTPVLGLEEAPFDAHNQARGVFVEVDGTLQPSVTPRFSATPGAIQSPPPRPGEHNEDALADWGFSPAEIARLMARGILGDPSPPSVSA